VLSDFEAIGELIVGVCETIVVPLRLPGLRAGSTRPCRRRPEQHHRQDRKTARQLVTALTLFHC